MNYPFSRTLPKATSLLLAIIFTTFFLGTKVAHAAVSVGDSYQGGIIGYILQSGDPGYNPNVISGLIAAPNDQGNSQWSMNGNGNDGASGTALGTGQSNTANIINSEGSSNNAAGICQTYNGGGYSDWFLPSKDELHQLDLNQVAIGGFSPSLYWSSSEYSSTFAWADSFQPHAQGGVVKSDTLTVRCVRNFSIPVYSPASRFITTWTTTTPNEQITIPINPAYNTYNYNVDWGDGSLETGDTTSANHTYATAGTYTVSITGTFPAIYFNDASDASLITSVEQWGTTHWLSMNSAFYGCSNLVINASDTPDLSGVTDMSLMFKDDTALNQSLNSWDVSHVTSMNSTFVNDSALNQPFSAWNVSNVTDMTGMFKNDGAFDQDLSSWNVSHVTSMINMLQSVTLSTTYYDALLEAWSLESLHTGVTLFAGNSKYCPSAASARASIISNHSWGILDGGLATCNHTITYNAGPNGTLTGTTSQTVGDTATGTAVTAIANSGYHFVNWSDNSVQNPRTDTDVTADLSVTANFALTPVAPISMNTGSGLPLLGCKDPKASNYNQFSMSDPELCTYTSTSTSIPKTSLSPIIPTTTTVSARTLIMGMKGSDVKAIQIYLSKHGFKISTDGVYGTKTKKAVQAFQKAHKISSTGVVDSKTLMLMK